jgi:type I restriction enzyme S subunit
MNWTLKKLGEVAEVNPRRPRIDRDDDVMTSFVPMEAVDEVMGAVKISTAKPYGALKKGYTYFQENDVIFAKITPCMQNGKHAIVRDLIDGFGFGSTEFHVVRAGPELHPDWVYFFIRREETLKAAMRTFTGAVGQQRVPPGFLEELEIPVPPLEEQVRISSQVYAQLAEAETARVAVDAQLSEVKLLPKRILSFTFRPA